MRTLTTLGGVGLADRTDPSAPHPVLAQPKRLALLVHLAVAHPGSLAFRDALLNLLWPDRDTSSARRALRQTLYHLRRELGDGVIVVGGRNGVGVDLERLRCDAVAFERAIADDRLDEAVALYAGDFMPGFHAGCGTEYERWIDGTRDRLRRKAVAAASALAERAETDGDVRRAIEHARWLVDVAPWDERAARLLIRLLARSGDRAAALAAYRDLAARLARDLDLEPDEDTRTLAGQVREGRTEGAARTTPGPRTGAAASGVRHALAVLPFATLSGTAAELRFAEGLTELLITELVQGAAVDVISRTSVSRHRTGAGSLPAVARELGVDHVVEGTVQQSGDRLRATAQLLATPPERHVWADTFELEVADPMDAQAELAGAIARGIESALAHRASDRATSPSAAARDAYFRGRCQFVRMTPRGFTEATRQFQEAIRLDPAFARAHAALAYAEAVLARSGRIAPCIAYPRARRRADEALALDPDIADAHLVLGICATLLDWDWPAAERHMLRAIQRGPDLPDSYWAYSNLLVIAGRPDEARRAARRARELDPVAPTFWLNEVLILVATGAIPDAATCADRFIAFHHDSSASAFAHGMAREALGDHAAAADSFACATELGGGAHSVGAWGHNLALSGRTDAARALLDDLAESRNGYVPPTAIARIHAALGRTDEAFRWLDRAAAVRDDWLLFMDGWPRFEGIRDDPRFDALRRRIGLPDPPLET